LGELKSFDELTRVVTALEHQPRQIQILQREDAETLLAGSPSQPR